MKERLTGAIILVALIVLLVPELLTGPIRTKAASAAFRPATPTGYPEAPVRSYTLTLTAPPSHETGGSPAGQAPAQPADSHPESTPSSQGLQPQTPPTVTAPPQSSARVSPQSAGIGPDLQAEKSAAHSSRREAGSSGGWAVQLGSFASRANAERLARSLTRKGFHMSVSPARAGSRTLWRVRAGPAHDRAGAMRLATRLRGLGHRGELLPVR